MPEINKITDMYVLRKMQDAGQAHLDRLNKNDEERFPLHPQVLKAKKQFVSDSIRDVKMQIGKLISYQ